MDVQPHVAEEAEQLSLLRVKERVGFLSLLVVHAQESPAAPPGCPDGGSICGTSEGLIVGRTAVTLITAVEGGWLGMRASCSPATSPR